MSGGSADFGLRQELERIQGVSDMLCSGQSELHDRYSRRAFALDLAVLGSSTWLIALAFVDPQLNMILTPREIEPRVWIGILGVATFFLTIVQLKANWNGRADAHRQCAKMYAQVKRDCIYLLRFGAEIDVESSRRVFSRYDNVGDMGIGIPERDFLVLKRKHRLKVKISQYLDEHPGTWPWVARYRVVVRDNLSALGSGSDR